MRERRLCDARECRNFYLLKLEVAPGHLVTVDVGELKQKHLQHVPRIRGVFAVVWSAGEGGAGVGDGVEGLVERVRRERPVGRGLVAEILWRQRVASMGNPGIASCVAPRACVPLSIWWAAAAPVAASQDLDGMRRPDNDRQCLYRQHLPAVYGVWGTGNDAGEGRSTGEKGGHVEDV